MSLTRGKHMGTIWCSGYQIWSVCSHISHSEPISGLQNPCQDLHAHTSWLQLLLGHLGPQSPALRAGIQKPDLGGHPQGFLYVLKGAKSFCFIFVNVSHPRACKDTGQCKEWHCTQSFLLWTHSLRGTVWDLKKWFPPLTNLQHCQLSQCTAQFSRHGPSASPLICLAAVPGMQQHPREEELCQLAGIHPKRGTPHVLGACQGCSCAFPSSQDLPSPEASPSPWPVWDHFMHQEMKFVWGLLWVHSLPSMNFVK